VVIGNGAAAFLRPAPLSILPFCQVRLSFLLELNRRPFDVHAVRQFEGEGRFAFSVGNPTDTLRITRKVQKLERVQIAGGKRTSSIDKDSQTATHRD
jgi:hypothetical protein